MEAAEKPVAPRNTGERVLALLRELTEELDPDTPARRISPESELGADLGLDSLARTELLLRLQREFAVELPDETLLADRVGDLIQAVEHAGAADAAARPAVTAAIPEPEPAEVGVPDAATSLIEVLEWHAEHQPDRLHIHFEGEAVTYGQLYRRARIAAAGLFARGVEAGDAVVIMLPSGLEYFYTFFGAMMIGALPVPIYPPARRELALDHIRRHWGIMQNAGARLLVSSAGLAGPANILRGAVPEALGYVDVRDLLSGDTLTPLRPGADALAFLQYTSGSTGEPKGVMLTHECLLANMRTMGSRARVSGDDRFVSWLPLYHDMGLIGAWLCTLYHSCPLYLMPPLHFLARPSRWLRAISEHGGTITASPNFGYELCLQRIDDEELEGVDLSTLRLALNGAEPVRPDTLRRFNERFSRFGLPDRALKAVYGLAETSLGLTIPSPDAPLRIERFDRRMLERRARAVPASEEDGDSVEIVSCGPPVDGQEVRIVDATGHELPEAHEGSIEFRGPSSCIGYYRNTEATGSLFHDDWLVTGDRGFVSRGELFITGRVKDMIIRGGRNIHPAELEAVVGEIDGVRKGCVAGLGDAVAGEERLVVVAETRTEDAEGRRRLEDEIRKRTVDLLNLPPDDIVLCPPHSIPKTSSGKIRRADTLELYRDRQLGTTSHRPVRQTLVLAGYAIRARLAKLRVYFTTYAYSGYAWLLLVLLGVLTWTAVVFLPVRRARWQALRTACRGFCRLAGIGLDVRGVSNLPAEGNWVLVCNHTSYLDSMMLLQAVPHEMRFVAKRELGDRWVQRIFLERLGTIFVERGDPREGSAAVDALRDSLRAGERLAVFPEGTFYRDPKLLPFRMGAFLAAAQTGTAVVPAAVGGVHDILRSESWLLRRSDVTVSIERPVEPRGSDWKDALSLRRETRSRLGEVAATRR